MRYHAYGTGPQTYAGPAPVLYHAILISHIVLAVPTVPLALVTLRRGWTRHPSHRRIARVTLPIWLYVSITGVVVFASCTGDERWRVISHSWSSRITLIRSDDSTVA